MMEGNRIGIVGGGQLGRMETQAAVSMGFEVMVLEKSENCPAAQVGADQIVGEITDAVAIAQLAARNDVVTWEIEHINADMLCVLSEDYGINVQPSPFTLAFIKDKFEQKKWLKAYDLPIGPYMPGYFDRDYSWLLERNPSGIVVKSREGGYDGRGNLVLDTPDIDAVKEKFGEKPIYLEAKVDIQKELSVITARDLVGQTAVYPVVEMVNSDNICNEAFAPAPIDPSINEQALEVAHETMKLLDGAGVFAIEMFLTTDNEVLVNEIAPRVHNSGHWSIEGSATSQFEQHIRAITGMPLGETELTAPAAVMINILGEHDDVPVDQDGLDRVNNWANTSVHWYGKSPVKVARKMGHITILGDDLEKVREQARAARKEISV